MGWLDLCDKKGLSFIRPGARVKMDGRAGRNGGVPVSPVLGTGPGQEGIHPPLTARQGDATPQAAVDLPEETRRKIYARYFELLTEALQQAVREAKPGSKRSITESAAGQLLVRKLDAEAKGLGITSEDWLPIVQQGLADKWPAIWRER